MSFLTVMPEQIESAAQDLAGIRSALGESYAAATAPTTTWLAAAEDEVSTAIASVFGAFGRQFHVLSAQAAAFHDDFANLLNTGAGAYISTEVANAESNLLNAVNAPAQGLFGHPSTPAGAGAAPRLMAALQAAESELAKGGGELVMAGQSALAGVAEVKSAVVDLVHAGGAFAVAGTDAVAGLAALKTSATNLVQGVNDIVRAGDNAVSGLGLLGTAVGEVFNPATIALAGPSAVSGLRLLGTAAVEGVNGVHALTSVGQEAVIGVADLQRASAEFSQGVSDVMLAEQDAAAGLAALQSAGTEVAQGVSDVKTAADMAAAALGF